MKVSVSWLKEYVPVEMDPPALADALTMAGLEVETFGDRFAFLEKIRVGRVLEVGSHPDADRLRLCRVDVGDATLNVVCGAPNVQQGMLTAVALPGAELPDGLVVKESTIRGVRSQAMLCSEAELTLGTDADGIMTLDPALSVGVPLSTALGLSDTVFEIDLTPNRSDCLSIIGIAREVAALQRASVTYPDIAPADAGGAVHTLTSVTINAPDHCPRYAARLVTGVTVAPSPPWLQDKLLSVGQRPINNIVDVTNFVMLEMGQPLHAFDFDLLAENRIVVRTAVQGETFTTLDQKERVLSDHMLMICDGDKPVAVGGVMGGHNSEVGGTTTRVLIESAYFDPISVRRTSKKLGLSTDAAYRFERGVDPKGTVRALNRAARLIADLGGGTLVDGVIDAHPNPAPDRKIMLETRETNRLLGTTFTTDQIADYLKSIEFDVAQPSPDTLQVSPPSFRVDVERPEDLMEEVARLSGYNNIPVTYPLISAESARSVPLLDRRNRLKTLMTGLGFSEAVNYSFISHQTPDRLNLAPEAAGRRQLNILNPLTEEQSVMRTSLLPGLLESMQRNISAQEKNLKLFEVGKIFLSHGQETLPEEREMTAGIWTGARNAASWHGREQLCDFYDIKGAVEGLLKGMNIQSARFTRLSDAGAAPYLRAGHAAEIIGPEGAVGWVGEMDPAVLHAYDLKQPAFVFELDLQKLYRLAADTVCAKSIPKFPAISRDVTLIVDTGIETDQILESVRGSREALVETVELFDVFAGDPIARGKKSISFRITYRAADQTLEDEAVNRIHERISAAIIDEYKADLPA